ncbi:MAG: hypothetical protein EHM32_11450 [Spirochaetales bacterium]|nr:MAG: hypothetical protein EHM32_11450 [Spirochaetales bacterium]
MPFIRIDGFSGLVYVPEFKDAAARKHNCPDCAACLHCSDDKCSLCINRTTGCTHHPGGECASRAIIAENGD